MSRGEHHRYEEKIGAYALGHLGDDERTEFEAHLEGCPVCRAELEQLAPVAVLLPKVDPNKLEEPLAAPPAHLAEGVYERVGQERRREYRRRLAGIGLSAAAILVVLFALSAFFLLEEPGEQLTLQPVAARTALPAGFQNLEATATLRAEDYSTQIELEATGLTPGQTYALWLEKADSTRVSAGGFQAFDEGPITVYLSAALLPHEAVGLGLGTSDGETVLRKDLEGDDDGDLIVPSLLDRTLEDAREAAGPDFEVDAQEEGYDEQPGGTIVGQDPAPGERAQKGSTISVELSSGRRISGVTNRADPDSPELTSDESDSDVGGGESAEQALEPPSEAPSAPDVGLAQNAAEPTGTSFTANQAPIVIPGAGTIQELSSPGRTVPTPEVAPLPGVTPLPEAAPLLGSAPLPEAAPLPGAAPFPRAAPPGRGSPGSAPTPKETPAPNVSPDPETALPPEEEADPDHPGRPKGDPDHPDRPKGDNPGRPKGHPDHPGKHKGTSGR